MNRNDSFERRWLIHTGNGQAVVLGAAAVVQAVLAVLSDPGAARIAITAVAVAFALTALGISIYVRKCSL